MTDNKSLNLPLAPRDLMILAVLADGPNHGYGLIKEVEVRSDATVRLDPANLYRVLRRMRAARWIEEAQDTPESGDRRRTYTITGLGQAILNAEVTRLEQLLQRARPALANGEGP